MNQQNHKTVTNGIILVCVIAYFLKSQMFKTGFSGYELFYFENPDFQLFQLITHMFMHGSTTHLFFNMFGLWMFGNSVEQIWGHKKFLIFYFLCGFGAASIYLATNYFQFHQIITPMIEAGIPSTKLYEVFASSQYLANFPSSEKASIIFGAPVVGASGALYGVLVAFAFIFPNHKIMLIFLPFPVAAKYFVPFLLALDLLSEFTGFSIFGMNIAHTAHIGGAVTAIILLLTVMKRKPVTNDTYGIWRK